MLVRRLLIYIVSLALVVGVFQWVRTRFFVSPMTSGGRRLKPVAIPSGTGGSNLVIVDRSNTGQLLYVLRFRRAIPKGRGQYHLIRPRMKFYSGKNNAVLVTSDYGDVSVDQLGGPLSNQVYPRKGRLFGHVKITLGPVKSFVKGAVHRQKGQYRITLSRPIDFNYQQGLLTSRGQVLVRGDRLVFSGRRLTCELNIAQKKLDYLQIAHGDYLTIKDINAAAANGSSAVKPHVRPKPSPSLHDTHASPTARPGQSGHQPPPPVPSLPATPRPPVMAAKPPWAGTVYGLVFTEQVRVNIGVEQLAAHRLRLYFSSARRLRGNAADNAKASSVQTAAAAVPTQPSPPASHSSTTPASASPPGKRTVKEQNLVVHWKGPLVLRPVRSRRVNLLNPQDVILQAFGRSHAPVVMHDGAARVGYASMVRYHVATRRLRMDATGLAPAKFVDAQLGTVTCRKLLYRANSDRIVLTGPGQAIYRGKKSIKNQWNGTWQKRMQLTMARSTGGKSQIKSLRLSGQSTFYNALFKIRAQTMHALFAAASKGNTVLRQFTAHGHVHLQSSVGPPSAKSRRYDTLDANSLLLSTIVNQQTHTRQPSSLYAAGAVNVVFYQTGKALTSGMNTGAQPSASAVGASHRLYHLRAQYLRAAIEKSSHSTSPGAKASPTQILSSGRFTVGGFHAWRHVSLTISGGAQRIQATCSDLRGNRDTKLATLTGNSAAKTPARIMESDNWISSEKIQLNGASQDLNIPGAGQLYLTSGGRRRKPTHLMLSWNGRMYFRNQLGVATFFSHVVARLVGQPRRKSRLSAPVLRVVLAGRKKGRLHVSEIYAFTTGKGQHVQAEDASYNSAKLIDTRLYIKCHRLRYNAEKQHLLVAGKGRLSLENYRRTPAPTGRHQPARRGQSAFAWQKALDYRAATGRLMLSGGVRLVYRPMQPFVLSRSIAGAYTGPNKGLILLDASKLIAQLLRAGKTPSGGVALGMGGPAKLKSVHAYHAALELSGARLTADALAFDAQRQIAKAYSAAGRDARITTPDGKINAAAREIIWRLGKSSQSAITLIQPRASGSVP